VALVRESAGKEGDVMSEPDELFGQERDHSLRAAVQLRRNALGERGDLRDPHRGWVLRVLAGGRDNCKKRRGGRRQESAKRSVGRFAVNR